MANFKLLLCNEFILGPFNGLKRRTGGVKYTSERVVGHHYGERSIAFSLLRNSLYDGFSIQGRKKEEEFLQRSGKDLCEFLGLNYESIMLGINLTWAKYDYLSSN